MGPGGPPMGPPPGEMSDKAKAELAEPKPKSIREVPRYILNITKKFFFRLFYIFGLVWETRKWIVFLMSFMAIWNGVTPVISSLIAAKLLNTIAKAFYGNATFRDIALWLLLTFGFSFLTSLVNRFYQILNNIAGSLVVNCVNIKMMEKAKEIDLASFDRPEFYEKMENANREAGNRPIQILNSTFTIVSTLISMVSFIIILSGIAWFAPLCIVVLSIPTAIVNFSYRKKNFLYMRRKSKARRQMSYYNSLMTNKDTVKEVRIFHLSDTFINKYKEVFQQYFAGLKKLFIAEGLWHSGITVLSSLVHCSLFLLVAKGVCEHRYEVGDYSLYTGALNSISNGITTLISTTAIIYEGTLFIDNLITFMNEKKTIYPSLASPRKINRHVGHHITLEHVSFRYPGTDRDVLHDINLTLNPGDTCVLVGLNGAGKTTLIKLLTRLYDPTEGTIFLDGHDIREYDVDDLYAMFGIIFQDFGKYAFSVAENIHFGQIDKPFSMDAIRHAARQSDAEAFISHLPDQYDTPLMRYFEGNGIELSIGQWQKLSIARAFYSDSDVLILDEPTASLDAIAEQEIYNQFDSLRKDKTTIFVSHRLSSATTANKIVVLDHGRIVEMGDHTTLMNQKGEYYRLFSTQAKRYITNETNESNNPFHHPQKPMEQLEPNTAPSSSRVPHVPHMPPPQGFPPGQELPPSPPNDFPPPKRNAAPKA